jgi:carbon starvation protein CstA
MKKTKKDKEMEQARKAMIKIIQEERLLKESLGDRISYALKVAGLILAGIVIVFMTFYILLTLIEHTWSLFVVAITIIIILLTWEERR